MTHRSDAPTGKQPRSVVAEKAAAAARPPSRLQSILCLDDFEPAAKRYLPRPLFGYVSGYTERGTAYRGNSASFEAFDFVPRALTDVSGRSQVTELLGKTYRHPFGIPPLGLSAAIALDADVVLASVAAEAGIPFILSASSLTPLERVASEGGASWYQAYLPGDPDRIETLVNRVEAAGYDTFVLTADVPVASNRENNVRNGFTIPLKPSLSLAWQGLTHPAWLMKTAFRTLATRGMPHFENMDSFRGPPILSRNLVRAIGARDQFSWTHLQQIRKRWKGKLLVKGIVSPDDVRMAREVGCDGAIISNHGGRQLDGVVAPLLMLPEIRSAIGREFPLILDGGVRRGTDVLKALALGADFVLVGRPFIYAAAIAGRPGVRHAIRLLADEVDRDLALLGCTQPSDVGVDHVRRRVPAS